MYLGTHRPPIRSLGLAALFASMYFVRKSRARGRSDFPLATTRDTGVTKAPGTRRRLWMLSLTMVPLLGVALLLMYIDSANGGREVWPAYVFAGVAIVCAGVWGSLAFFVIAGSK
jgi:hypothetical protein